MLRSVLPPAAFALILGYSVSSASAGVVLGAGDITPDDYDRGANLSIVDQTHTQLLSAGTYVASTFNFQFGNVYAPGAQITPFLTDGNGNVIAVGNMVMALGPEPFHSVSFGGVFSFTLATAQYVYAGVHWLQPPGGGSMPIGFKSDGGSAASIHYFGADYPTLGSPLTGGAYGVFYRAYDFSITVEGASAVPEPGTLAAAGMGAFALAGLARRRSRARA